MGSTHQSCGAAPAVTSPADEAVPVRGEVTVRRFPTGLDSDALLSPLLTHAVGEPPTHAASTAFTYDQPGQIVNSRSPGGAQGDGQAGACVGGVIGRDLQAR